VLRIIIPLDPDFPAFEDLISTDPLDDEVLYPVDKTIDPPVNDDVNPLDKNILPPLPLSPEPTSMLISPPVPETADPEPREIDPLSPFLDEPVPILSIPDVPELDVPVLKLKLPLIPDKPALAEDKTTAPLELDCPKPPVMVTMPPVFTKESPPDKTRDPPIPLLPRPTVT
jgi:hypothetical protein